MIGNATVGVFSKESDVNGHFSKMKNVVITHHNVISTKKQGLGGNNL
jgi:hypothetical protein